MIRWVKDELKKWWKDQPPLSKFVLSLILVGLIGILVLTTRASTPPGTSTKWVGTARLTTPLTTKPVTTTSIMYAANGHPLRACSPVLKNNTNYSYCTWSGPEQVPGHRSVGSSFSADSAYDKKPIVGSNFSYAIMSYSYQATDSSGMYSFTDHASITIRPFHDCTFHDTQFPVDVAELQALNSQPLDGYDFSSSTISGDTLKGMAGRWVNFSGANLKGANLSGSDFTHIIGNPASLPLGWSVTTSGTIVHIR